MRRAMPTKTGAIAARIGGQACSLPAPVPLLPMLLMLAVAVPCDGAPETESLEPSSPHPPPPPPDALGPALLDTAEILIEPVEGWPRDALILIPAGAATALALRFDVPLHRMMRNSWPDPPLMDRRISSWGSLLGEGAVDAGIFAVAGLVDGDRGARASLEGLEALAAVAITSRALKVALRVERPSFDPNAKHYFSARVMAADAMPSGHAMSVFATAQVLAEEYQSLAPLWYLVAAYVGIARVQQNTHWVSDVIAGAALGIVYGRAAVGLHRHFPPVQVTPRENGLAVVAMF